MWRLDQSGCTPSAPIGGLDCYVAASSIGGGGPTLYGHVVREDGDIVLEWAFYYDVVYSYAYPASDFIWQAHEGDWEVVSVVLDADEQPLSIGYSQHCLGRRRAWADTSRVDGTHPVVHVAVGSHANYFSTGTHPIPVACIPPAAVAILLRNHLPLPVDYAFDGGAVVGSPGSGDRWGRSHSAHRRSGLPSIRCGTTRSERSRRGPRAELTTEREVRRRPPGSPGGRTRAPIPGRRLKVYARAIPLRMKERP